MNYFHSELNNHSKREGSIGGRPRGSQAIASDSIKHYRTEDPEWVARLSRGEVMIDSGLYPEGLVRSRVYNDRDEGITISQRDLSWFAEHGDNF